MSLREAAERYAQRGWVTTALEPDSDGFPKKPYLARWQHTKLDSVPFARFEESRAQGIGVVLGPASGNLAVIDIDDTDLAAAVLKLFHDGGMEPYWVNTARKRGHLYLREKVASQPRYLTVVWEGREVGIELKAKGQQVAAPPTPGYEHVGPEEPMMVPAVLGAWNTIALQLGLKRVTPESGGGYPKPWADHIPEGERNKSLFVEACMCRDAGMPLQTAVDLMTMRVHAQYENGRQMSQAEIGRTIASAYRRPRRNVTNLYDHPDYRGKLNG